MGGQTLYDKLWQSHLVEQRDDGTALVYIDLHLIHEVTSPQAFEGLRLAGRAPWRRDANLAVPDHNVPTERTEDHIAREPVLTEHLIVLRLESSVLDGTLLSAKIRHRADRLAEPRLVSTGNALHPLHSGLDGANVLAPSLETLASLFEQGTDVLPTPRQIL